MSDSAAAGAAPAATLDNFHAVVQHNLSKAQAAEQQTQQQAPAPKPAGRAPIDHGDQPVDERESELAAAAGQQQEGDDLEAQLDGDEDSEAVVDLLEQELHGHKGRAILEALAKGEMPAELLAQIKAVAKVGGQDLPITLQEALAGYQRLSDYTKGKKELQALKRETQERFDGLKGLIDGWSSGETLLSGLKRLGKMDAFRQAAISYARTEWENEQLRAKNPAAYEARLELQREREKREALEQKMQNAPDPNRDRQTQQFADQLQQLVFPAFTAAGIRDTPFARERFSDNFRAVYDPDADLGELVTMAARATAEELSDLAERYAKTQQNGANPKPPAPPPTKQQGAPAAGQRAVPKRMTPGEMDDFLRARRERRR